MPIITIFGANGTQGSAVLEAVLADGKFTPRAVSRSLESPGSKTLIARGIEVAVANLFDKGSVVNAMRGSEAVYAVTNFWDPAVSSADPEGKGELIQGKNLVDAAKEVGVKFFIWSSLPNATRLSKGLYKHIYHFDNKAEIEDYLRLSGVPHAMVVTGWFIENLWNLESLQKTETGYTLPIPKFAPEDVQEAAWIAHDLGQAAVALLTHYPDPSKGVLGKTYPVVSWRFTYSQLAKEIGAAIKKEVTFTPPETSGLLELDEMFLLQAKIGMYGDTPVPNPALLALGVKFASLKEFIEAEIVPRFA
ncbi:hypothetical protein C8F04DRAFT_1248470 [Mycena alexandri]|uniref:NmrA-like domain-containing protein n=1 Tax=Mycena alexandri TaxID=1745969 RepID=A0AAD6THB0_9AGAR|nr:hypothetical protein C8F04DRAFT_1248470 [Mycena alexandri]